MHFRAKNWRLTSLKGNLLRSKGHKNDPSAKIQCCATSLFLCPSLQYLHSSSLFFLQILFGFLPELYVESLFVFHIGLIQWSVCMFVRSVMWMHDSNLTLCGRLCHTKSIFKYNQKGNIVYGLSSHLFKPFWTRIMIIRIRIHCFSTWLYKCTESSVIPIDLNFVSISTGTSSASAVFPCANLSLCLCSHIK